jgi:hypothetical protein
MKTRKLLHFVCLLSFFPFIGMSQTATYIGTGADVTIQGVVSFIGDAVVADATKLTCTTSADVLFKESLTVTTNSLGSLGRFTFTNAAAKNVTGVVSTRVLKLTTGSSLTLSGTASELKATDSMYLDGIVTTGTNVLTLGTSTATPGSLVYTSGYVNGNMRRWFSPSTVSNVLFPFGASNYYSPAKISFTSAPTAGGSLLSKYIYNTVGVTGILLFDTAPLTDIVNLSTNGFWQMDAENGLTGGTYSLSLTTNNLNGVNDASILRIVKRPTSTASWASNNWVLNGTHVAGTSASGSYTTNRSGMSGFSQFGIASPSVNPLPVELTYFNGVCNDGVSTIKWQTASERNSDKFIVERSLDGSVWEAVSEQNAAGNSNSLIDYSYIDNAKSVGTRYYRLSQYDINGDMKKYDAISTSCAGSNDWNVSMYPNPSRGEFNVAIESTSEGEGTIKITMANGKVVTSKSIDVLNGQTNQLFDLTGVSTGVYYVTLEFADKKETKKLIIE